MLHEAHHHASRAPVKTRSSSPGRLLRNTFAGAMLSFVAACKEDPFVFDLRIEGVIRDENGQPYSRSLLGITPVGEMTAT